jgi:uncharacterized protein (DUF433 family)
MDKPISRDELVSELQEAKANIDRYQRELASSQELQAIMSKARQWHGYRAPDGSWRVGPSKFIGYVNNDAATYLRLYRERDGRRTEGALRTWFRVADPGSAEYEDVTAAVLRLFAKYGRAPNKLLQVNVPRPEGVAESRPEEAWQRSHLRSRVTFDARVCGGRPCIRGMRIRVSDILDMLSAGVTRQEILIDYPYLEDEDISAALAYAAESTDHRVVSAA